ncbi:hypothetical protein BDY21DRAFT_322370 [Lineolata rhizophorae]|uniref:Urease accessory protein UreF n=1 Tax=Lineolata rhizophorae TaxID=578093 RepID=A0A6A6NYT7_9PEZI|nr:hypothetical protein BDY21DRAFT_322370 [Lineolata rhizophorae]
MGDAHDPGQLRNEIADLKQRLAAAEAKLNSSVELSPASPTPDFGDDSLRAILLLADSALPLGSFAFSSGLESFLAHQKQRQYRTPIPTPNSNKPATLLQAFHHFLSLSLSSLATTSLPYVLAAYRDPAALASLDNACDASTPCTVARRASTAQGRALLAVWDRSFKPHYGAAPVAAASSGDASSTDGDDGGAAAVAVAIDALAGFSTLLRTPPSAFPTPAHAFPASAHFAPLFGAVTRALRLRASSAAYAFLFAHARTVVSAGVRASVLGPYQAQAVLADGRLGESIRALVREMWDVDVEDAGQCVPVLDLWVGRHEVLYSRIFNS